MSTIEQTNLLINSINVISTAVQKLQVTKQMMRDLLQIDIDLNQIKRVNNGWCLWR